MTKTRKRCRVCNHADRDELEERLNSLSITTDNLDEEMDWPSGVAARHLRNHMGGEFNDESNPKCKLCTAPNREELELAIHDGNLAPTDLAAVLEIPRQQILKHMEKHLKPIVQKSAALEIVKKDFSEIEVLASNIENLNVKIQHLFAEEDLGPKYIDSLTKLAKEIRESLKYLMEFKGQLVHKRQDTVIIAQMNIVQEVLAQNHPNVWIDVKKKMEERLQ